MLVKRTFKTSFDYTVVEAIPLQIHQLFYNLINNSLKFSKENQPAIIRISSRHLPPEEVKQHPELLPELSFCEITLSDNGIGFNPEFSEQIFGLFKRLGTRKTFSGSGIGLALCRKVVNNHNGVIYAEGQVQEGATFHIILPIHQPTHHQIANTAKAAES